MGLVLKIRGQGSSHTKMAWTDDQWDPPPYSVSRELVAKAAGSVRAVLNRISEEYLTSPKPDYRPFLPDLIEAGADLSAELFDPVEGARETAAQAQDLIAGAQGRQRLTINSDASIHVPWGFVFDGDGDRDTIRRFTGTSLTDSDIRP
jgi:hypothetical protein